MHSLVQANNIIPCLQLRLEGKEVAALWIDEWLRCLFSTQSDIDLTRT